MKGSDVEAMTKLLKAHGVPLSAVRANRLLIELGFLEEATRESATRPGVTKTYKVVTEAGLDFGVNEENPQSPGQSSPYWYKDSFGELAAKLVAADEAGGSSAAKGARTEVEKGADKGVRKGVRKGTGKFNDVDGPSDDDASANGSKDTP